MKGKEKEKEKNISVKKEVWLDDLCDSLWYKYPFNSLLFYLFLYSFCFWLPGSQLLSLHFPHYNSRYLLRFLNEFFWHLKVQYKNECLSYFTIHCKAVLLDPQISPCSKFCSVGKTQTNKTGPKQQKSYYATCTTSTFLNTEM